MPQLELRDKVQPQYPLMCLPSPTQEVLVGSFLPHKKAFKVEGRREKGKGQREGDGGDSRVLDLGGPLRAKLC